MAVTAAELKVLVAAQGTEQTKKDIAGVGTAVDKTSGKQTAGARASAAASKAIIGGTAAVGAAYAASITQAADFQQQLANINTVARLNESDTNALGDALQQAARDTGISTEELTSSMYDLVSAGTITSEQLHSDLAGSMEVVSHAADLAIGGMGNLAGTTDVLTSALNAYNLDASHAGEVTDLMAVAIERGKVTADEIGSSLANVAPIAANAGISLEEISATYATLTANGVPAAEATTQMRAAITALLSPNEKLKDIMADTGLNFAQIAKDDGLQVALQKLRDVTIGANKALDDTVNGPAADFPARLKANQEALGLTNTEMQKLIDTAAGPDGVEGAYRELTGAVAGGDAGLSDALGRVEGFNFLLQTTGENSAAFGENYQAAMDATGTAAEQADIAMQGPAQTANRLAQNVLTFMQDVGGPAAQTVGPFLLAMNQLGPAMMLPIKASTALGGAIGGLVGKGLTTGVPLLTRFSGLLGKGVVSGAGRASGALGKLGVTLAKGAVFAAGYTKEIGKMALEAAPQIASGLKGALGKALSGMGGVLSKGLMALVPALGGAVSGLMSGIMGLLSAALPILAAGWPILLIGAIVAGIALLILNPEIRDKVFGFIGSILKWIGDALAGLGRFLGEIFGGAFEFLGQVIGKYIEIITLPWRVMFQVISTIVTTAFQILSGIFGAGFDIISGVIQAAWDFITGIFKTAIDFIAGLFRGAVDTFGSIWDAIAGAIGAAVDVIVGIIGGIADVVGAVWDTVAGFFDFITGGTDKATNDINAVNALGANYGGGAAPQTNMGGTPHYQQGTMFVPDNQLAFLHKGEMVIPARESEAVRSNKQGEPFTGAHGGSTVINNHYTANVQGIVPVRSVRDIGRGLRLAGETGQLVARRRMMRAESYVQ